MKKRCTNSACRKEFRPEPGIARCPHCGRKYPRLRTCATQWKDARPHRARKTAAVKNRTYAVVLTGWQGKQRLPLVKLLRLLTGCGLRDAMEATKRPTIVARELPWEEAERFALRLEQEWGTVALVPDRNAENYGVPLSAG